MDVKIELTEDIVTPAGVQKTTFKAAKIDSSNDLKQFMTSVYKEIWPTTKK